MYINIYINLNIDAGKYFDNSKVSATGPAAIDEALAKFVWEESERLTGLKFSF
jgi:hypothetical protein